MSAIWITADTHFGHHNIIEFCKRPFSSAAVMDEALIANWNARVGDNDHVYHLGDVALCHKRRAADILAGLKGKIHLIRGNHDRMLTGFLAKRFESVSDIKTLGVAGHKIELCHYPLESWKGSNAGTYHFHGHSHGNMELRPRRRDVGIDCTEAYAPVLVEEWIADIAGTYVPVEA